MKHYYIIENRIIGLDEPQSDIYDNPKLSESQAEFYEANPNATVQEVLNKQLNVVEIDEFAQAKGNLEEAWHNKLDAGYTSIALTKILENNEEESLTMSLTNSIIDNEDVFLKAQKLEFVLKNSVIPQLQSAGMTEQMINDYEIDIRDKQGIKHKKSISQALDYIAEMTKIGLKINEINGALFDAETQADLDAIDISFNWSEVI